MPSVGWLFGIDGMLDGSLTCSEEGIVRVLRPAHGARETTIRTHENAIRTQWDVVEVSLSFCVSGKTTPGGAGTQCYRYFSQRVVDSTSPESFARGFAGRTNKREDSRTFSLYGCFSALRLHVCLIYM
jgi:hypothetical protein